MSNESVVEQEIATSGVGIVTDVMAMETDAMSDASSVFYKESKLSADYKYELPKNTTLVFVSLKGEKTEKNLNVRVENYTELQREIAKLLPKSAQMFLIQDMDGNRILPDNFIPSDFIRVKEIMGAPVIDSFTKGHLKVLNKLPYDWEDHDYHATILENMKYQREDELSDEDF
jgi:hypothetical protein